MNACHLDRVRVGEQEGRAGFGEHINDRNDIKTGLFKPYAFFPMVRDTSRSQWIKDIRSYLLQYSKVSTPLKYLHFGSIIAM